MRKMPVLVHNISFLSNNFLLFHHHHHAVLVEFQYLGALKTVQTFSLLVDVALHGGILPTQRPAFVLLSVAHRSSRDGLNWNY